MDLQIFKNDNFQKLVCALLILVCCGLYVRSCNNHNIELNRLSNNFDAYKDSTKTIKLKNGQLEYEKLLFITNKGELNKYSDSLQKELNKELKNVKIIWKEKIVIKDSIIYVDSSKYRKIGDSSYIIDWEFNNFAKTNSKINGNTSFVLYNKEIINLSSSLTNFQFSIDVVTGVREISKDRYITFVRTKDSNSTVSFKDIEGAIVDPSFFSAIDKDNIIIGPYLGFGYSDKFEFNVGIGVTFKLFGIHF